MGKDAALPLASSFEELSSIKDGACAQLGPMEANRWPLWGWMETCGMPGRRAIYRPRTVRPTYPLETSRVDVTPQKALLARVGSVPARTGYQLDAGRLKLTFW